LYAVQLTRRIRLTYSQTFNHNVHESLTTAATTAASPSANVPVNIELCVLRRRVSDANDDGRRIDCSA